MGCIKSLISLLLLLVVAAVLFLNRDRVIGKWHELRGDKANVVLVPSPELADSAAARIASLDSGRQRRIALSEVELQSLLLYKFRSVLPGFVDSPRVELKGDRISVHARIPVDRLPQVSELGEAASFLPDTTDVAVSGQLLPLRKGRVALTVDQVTAARIPLPRRLLPGALRKLGRHDEPGLPADAMSVPLPPGADAAYVRNDSLVFLKN